MAHCLVWQVRETCFKGALAIINTYLESAAALLLPPLQRGLADDNYRIRQSSSELLGSLMARLTGGEYMEVVELGEEVPEDSPLATIPIEQQHALLAAVYIARNDTQPGVRSAASAVWKSLIANAPKALRIILRALTDQLIEGLSTDDEDTQAGAAQALGEVRALDPSTCCCSLLQPACPRSPNAPSCLPPLTKCIDSRNRSSCRSSPIVCFPSCSPSSSAVSRLATSHAGAACALAWRR